MECRFTGKMRVGRMGPTNLDKNEKRKLHKKINNKVYLPN